LELERLLLRPFSKEDSKRVQLLAGDKSVVAGAINLPHPYSDGMAESWINTHEDAFIKGNSLILAISLKDSGMLIGSIGLYINGKNEHAELGYWIGTDYWGKGYCSEAVAGIVNYGFGHLKLQKIFANFISNNHASEKVLAKNGFLKEGYFKKHIKYNDRFWDSECYSLLSEEYAVKSNIELL
jgi:[ribosomal protein S5]-alanine N-acetyltransferase